jgi:hypothetical protein
VNADHSIIESILDFLRTPQVQSALIAAVVSFIVACIVAGLTTRRERSARRAQRAERLLREVYDPIEICLKAGSLHRCVGQCGYILEKNRHDFPENILVLIDQALEAYVKDSPLDFGTVDKRRVQESENQLDGIAKKLVPLLEFEMDRLKNLAKKETW